MIRKIIEIYPSHLKKDAPLLIEFGYKQGEAVTRIADGFGLESHILTDIEGRDRNIVIKRK